jgi:hypothetical protein
MTVQPGINTIVPILGPTGLAPANVKTRFFETEDSSVPARGALLRSMWDGLMVVYYGRDADNADVEALRELARTRPDLNFVAVPWTGREHLPLGRRLAFAVWGTSQSCHRLAPQALDDFRTAHPLTDAPGVRTGQPPQVQVLSAGQRQAWMKCTDPGFVCRVPVLP